MEKLKYNIISINNEIIVCASVLTIIIYTVYVLMKLYNSFFIGYFYLEQPTPDILLSVF